MQLLIKHFKHKKLSTLIKHMACLLFIFLALIPFTNCGKRKPPLPPIERVAQRVAIEGTQIGNQIRIIWQMPARNASDGSLLNIDRADIYRLAEPLDDSLSLTEEEFNSRSTLIATVPIKDSDFALKQKTYIDTLQFAGQPARLRYAIRFVNSSGQKAAFSNFLLIEPSSRVALNPTNLKALVTQDQIILDWDAPISNVDNSSQVNILGYNLYRSGKTNNIKRINEDIIKENEFADEFFTFDDKYSYFVRTVSLGNNGEQVESISSETIEVTPKDTFAPNPPSAITIAAAPNNISIFFAVNIEKDVTGYKIYRSTDPNQPKSDWKLLTDEILRANTFQDTQVETGKKYFYYLTAIDKFGNISQPSEVVSETAF
jgi:fibronectin type 3 domain-containing protein